jgi:dephospho-CoA kinase
MIIGLTGSFGSGKTTVAGYFRSSGARIIDADAIAHSLLKPSHAIYRRIVRVFGQDILNHDATINRGLLAHRVFTHKKNLAVLNAIMHPAISASIVRQIQKFRRGIVIIDAPLLLESGLQRLTDAVIVVNVSKARQIQRLRKRLPHATKRDILARIASQIPLREKLRAADFIIDNNGSRVTTRKQVKQVWKQLSAIQGGCSGKIRHQ